MKRITTRLAMAAVLMLAVACSTNMPEDDIPNTSPNSGASEFAEFESPNASGDASPEAGIENELAGADAAAPADAATPDAAAGNDEFAQFDQPADESAPPAVDGGDPLAEAPPAEMAPPAEAPTDQIAELPAETPPAEMPPAEAPAPEVAVEQPAPEAPAAAEPTGRPVNITNIQFRANDNGGTVIIEGDGPLTFQQRMNSDTHQFVVEIPNSKLPRKLKRPFNTRDFQGMIGSIDAYQGKNSTTARIVVQLRGGAGEPTIQAEGNSLFVVAQPGGGSATSTAAASAGVPADSGTEETASEPLPSKLLSSESLEEFLSGNQQFYGKRISVETDDAELKDVFRLISDEANTNLIVSEEVKGKISLKLKNVPWDQALVMIMKAKKLGYTRAGNVLRIAPIADLRAEEDDSMKYIAARKASAPLKVKTISVNYAKVDDLEKQLRPLLSQKGSVVSDVRTSSIVLSDVDENMDRAEKLIRALDVPPQQVLIEGKVVEASDRFQRDIGVNWNVSGRQSGIANSRSSAGALHGGGQFAITPGLPSNSSAGISFSMGTLDVLGDLSASLQLFESQGMVKVLSSPRVVTLHNEPAEISQTTELPLITSTVNSNGQPVPQVNFKQVRLRLAVTPQITNDGAVILGVDVMREIPGPVADQASQARSVNTRAAKTKVIVKNSQTAVIGGIYQNDMTESETKVPVLGDLPVLGWLFKSRSNTKDRTELIIFVTPRIVGQLEGAPAATNNSDGGEF